MFHPRQITGEVSALMTTDPVIEFVDSLNNGKIFFFAGSGISYASNLPSAYAVLEHTANVFLPAGISDKEKKEICSTIQPEVFYESIISMTRSRACLDIWRSLHKSAQNEHGVECIPNFSHSFIVQYSSQHDVPIITTNFDSMFEQACDLLGIEYRVVLPTESPPDREAKLLSICKVHGSIQDNKEDYWPDSLETTMTQITKVKTKWIEYINALMADKHLCFVGYSGKDIDFFPFIAEISKTEKVQKIIWVNRFDGDHSDNASKSCGAIRVCQWPSELFESISNRMVKFKLRQLSTKQLTNDAGKMEELLSSLEKSLMEKKLLTDEEKELLYCILLAKLGKYRIAHKYAIEFETTKLSCLIRPSSKHLLLLTCARLSHERSRYESCRKYARQVLAMLKSKDGYDINTALQASCLVSEAYRMSIPNDTYFGQTVRFIDYLYVAFVIAHFMLTIFKANTKMFRNKLKNYDLSSETQHELIEHRIRFYALIQSILGSSQRGWNSLAKAFLIRVWDSIRDMSYQAGYAAGIANSGKFKYRLSPLEKTKSESANIYALITSATGTELLIRNEADQLLREGKFDESRLKFIEYANMANRSGNTLNEIKGILGFAYVNHMEGKMPLLTDELRRRYSALTSEVEGRRWKNHFAYIETIFAQGYTGARPMTET